MANDVILKQLHAALFEILCEFNRICQKHHIQYFLDSGTALGAIRHGGFIPWDDDIDVGMLRSEYDRFLKVVQDELSDNFFLLSRDSDPAYIKYHVKLVKKDTLFLEQGIENLKYPGIYIDIFPFDKVPETTRERGNFFSKVLNLRAIIRIKRLGNNNSNFFLKTMSILLKIVPLPLLEYYLDKVCKSYNNTTSRYVSCLFYKMLIGRDLYFPITVLSPSIEINFEGRSFLIMNGYDEYLKIMYKDYMQLPPENKRPTHNPALVKFSDGTIMKFEEP